MSSYMSSLLTRKSIGGLTVLLVQRTPLIWGSEASSAANVWSESGLVIQLRGCCWYHHDKQTGMLASFCFLCCISGTHFLFVMAFTIIHSSIGFGQSWIQLSYFPHIDSLHCQLAFDGCFEHAVTSSGGTFSQINAIFFSLCSWSCHVPI